MKRGIERGVESRSLEKRKKPRKLFLNMKKNKLKWGYILINKL